MYKKTCETIVKTLFILYNIINIIKILKYNKNI